MATRYTYACTLDFGTDGEADYCEVEVEVSYVVRWGAPEQGPTYACGGTPADPDEIDDIRLEKVNDKPRPWGMYDGFLANEDDEFATVVVECLYDSERHMDAMLVEAIQQAWADMCEADDRRWEERRDAELMERLG